MLAFFFCGYKFEGLIYADYGGREGDGGGGGEIREYIGSIQCESKKEKYQFA
jgi:hypothetical protein